MERPRSATSHIHGQSKSLVKNEVCKCVVGGISVSYTEVLDR